MKIPLNASRFFESWNSYIGFSRFLQFFSSNINEEGNYMFSENFFMNTYFMWGAKFQKKIYVYLFPLQRTCLAHNGFNGIHRGTG